MRGVSVPCLRRAHAVPHTPCAWQAREKELAERRAAAEVRQQLHGRMEVRERARRESVLEAEEARSEQAEQALKLDAATNALQHAANADAIEGEQQVVGAYEAAFRKIKESTGVAEVSEVIGKFINQQQTRDNLLATTRDAQARTPTRAAARNRNPPQPATAYARARHPTYWWLRPGALH